MEILKKTNIDFIGKRNIAFIFSTLLAVLGTVAFIQIWLGQANLGIDFAGGTSVQLRFDNPVQMDKARKVLEGSGFKDSALQHFTEGNKLLIRIKKTDIPFGEVSNKIVEVFTRDFPDNRFIIDSSTEIGPTIGKRLQKDAIVAVTISLMLILIYIAVRFEFTFGVAAVIATFHDVLAVLGVFYIFGKEINLLIVTALLTLAGYSLTDTVVVFDRIREVLRYRSKDPLDQVINSGINQVLSRTIITSLTTLLAVIALYILGGEIIHDFVFALMLGVIVGTYSSIFVASPIVYVWREKRKKTI